MAQWRSLFDNKRVIVVKGRMPTKFPEWHWGQNMRNTEFLPTRHFTIRNKQRRKSLLSKNKKKSVVWFLEFPACIRFFFLVAKKFLEIPKVLTVVEETNECRLEGPTNLKDTRLSLGIGAEISSSPIRHLTLPCRLPPETLLGFPSSFAAVECKWSGLFSDEGWVDDDNIAFRS